MRNYMEANWCPRATILLHGEELSKEEQEKRKAIFLEGLIRFLDIYAQTEIGEGIEIDIVKVALHINSACFENDDLYKITSINDVYHLLESLTIIGLPIWRFLKLTDYQKKIFETGYHELLISLKKKAADESPCYGCIWYSEEDTFLGLLRKCNKPETEFVEKRKGAHDPNMILDCKWLTTLESLPKSVDDIQAKRKKEKFLKAVEAARQRFQDNFLKDPFGIPKELSDTEIIELNKEYDTWDDLGCALNNKKTKSERQIELRKAIYTEGMIRFFEQYAKCEIGSNYITDITKIALYINQMNESELNNIKAFEDVYIDLENKIISGFNVRKYLKFDA